MRLAAVCLLMGITAPLAAAEPDAIKKDIDALQGMWDVEVLEYNGKNYKEKYRFSFVCKGSVLTIEGDDGVKKEYAKITLKLDPSVTPKTVDMTVGDGVQKDAVMEGIYELKDDQWKLCVKVFGKDRPSEFTSPEGGSTALLTLKRRK